MIKPKEKLPQDLLFQLEKQGATKIWAFQLPPWWLLLNLPAWLFLCVLSLVICAPPLPQNLALLNFIALVSILCVGWVLHNSPAYSLRPGQLGFVALGKNVLGYGSPSQWSWIPQSQIKSCCPRFLGYFCLSLKEGPFLPLPNEIGQSPELQAFLSQKDHKM